MDSSPSDHTGSDSAATAGMRPGRIAVGGCALVLGLVLVGARARFAFEPTDAPPRVFELGLWGLDLGRLAQADLVATLDPVTAPARLAWLMVAALLGWVAARRLGPLAGWAGSRVALALGLGAALFFAFDPGLAAFVAGRSFVGAPHYLEVEDALRGCGVLALLVAGLALWPRRPRERQAERGAGPSLVAAGLVAVLGPLAWSLVFLDGGPLTNDGQSYRFQAELFSAGHLSLPGGGWAEFFPARQVYAGDRVFSKYPPGHALVLALGGLVGSPLLAVRVLWFAGPLLVHRLARRLGVARPLLAAWLFALSPTPLMLGGLWLAHGTSLPTGLAFLVAVTGALDAHDRGDRRRAFAWSLAAGFALGLCGLARPGTALALAVAPAIAVAARPRRLATTVAGVALGALPWAVFFLVFNRATTGDPWLPGYVLYAREVSPDDRWGLVNAHLAFGHTMLSTARLDLWLHGFAGSAGLALLGLASVGRRRWLVLGVPAALAGFYALLRFHGLPWAGPLYWVEAFPLLCCASAAGIDRLGRSVGGWVERPILVAAVLGSLALAVTRGEGAARELQLRSVHRTAAAQAQGVVFVQLRDEPSRKRLFLAPPPGFVLDGGRPELLFAADRGTANDAFLRALGDPPAYRFDPRTGALVELER